jgi:hypothetical protein
MAESLSKLSEKCKTCPKVDECDNKRMELCALAELPNRATIDTGQIASVSASVPYMRERIKSPLSPFAYKDELEKALNDYYFGNRFMNSAT